MLNIAALLRSQAKVELIDQKRANLIRDEEFFAFAQYLTENGRSLMNYDGFCLTKSSVPAAFQRFFKPLIFLTFTQNQDGEITIDDFLRYVQRSMDVEKTMLDLLTHSRDPSFSTMTEQELERYIFGLVPETAGCQSLPQEFYPYYVFTASRRFYFYLDPRRTHKISIKKLAHSTIMEELLYLNRISKYDKDLENYAEQINSNWFSGQNALNIYARYMALDKDENGMLNLEEALHFTGITSEPVHFTRTAMERLFEENITYQPPEMDYKTYLDLVLALDNRTTLESLTYFWRILDVEKCGRLTPRAINYFYKDIFASLRATGYDAPAGEHVVVEIYDILACNDAAGPTFADLVKSGQGHVVTSMLLDINGFWMYDNRESLAQQRENENEEPVAVEQIQQ